MNFFELGTKVITDISPNTVFQIVQEETHGWVLQVVGERRDNQMMSLVSDLDLKEGDVVYISHSLPMSMKAINDTEATQNDEDTIQNNQETTQDEANHEDAGEVVVPADVLERRPLGGIGAEMVRAMINNAERNM